MKIQLLTLGGVLGDVYLHHPKGSNNRLNEAQNTRKNANRVFGKKDFSRFKSYIYKNKNFNSDSQNNNNGGYNVGDRFSTAAINETGQNRPVYFQSAADGGDTELEIEWWNQHGCGKIDENDANSINCQIVLQYTCQDSSKSSMKNGFSTNTASWTQMKNKRGKDTRDNNEKFAAKKARKTDDYEKTGDSGEHESWEYYDACFMRERNNGIFVADQNRAQNRGATRTRQNPAGTRRGFECPEERDYFPYWHPTPWIDMAILTSLPETCDFYETESSNRKGRFECVEYYEETVNLTRKHASTASTEEHCLALHGKWTEFFNFLEIAPAQSETDCQSVAENMNKIFGEEIIWAVPYLDGENRHLVPEKQCLILPPKIICEKAPWSRANHLGNDENKDLASFKWTLPHFHFLEESKDCAIRIRYNISSDDYAQDFSSETYFENQHFDNDPEIEVHPKMKLRLAANSAQLGRTFQDRTHIFEIQQRPTTLPKNAKLVNLGVRGRRGNIVQTFPSVEYDFTPNRLVLDQNTFVHVQWDGSNSQPKNQAGEGRDQTDRSNMVPMGQANWNIPIGKLEEKYSGEFTVPANKYTAEKTYEYKFDIESTYNRADAVQFCARYGMGLPEPTSEVMTDQILKIWKTDDGKFRGNFFLGLSDEAEEGKFVFDSNLNQPVYTNWKRRRGPQISRELNYVAFNPQGQWNLVQGGRTTRFASVLCLREKNSEKHESFKSNMFSEADWIWSSLTDDSNILSNNSNLLLQMASSGYFTCETAVDCGEESIETKTSLDETLDEAPASFHGNIFRPGKGKHFYMSTRNNNFSNRAQKGFIQV